MEVASRFPCNDVNPDIGNQPTPMKKSLLLAPHALAALVLSFVFVACDSPREEAAEDREEVIEEVNEEVD